MPDENKNGGDFGGPWLLLFVIVVLVILVQAARSGMGGGFGGGGIRTGTPSRTGTVEEKLSRQPMPSGGSTSNASPRQTSPPAVSQNNIFLSLGNTAATDPSKEYISLYYSSSASEKIVINGWALENALGERGFISSPTPIAVEPGTRITIVTGSGQISFFPAEREWRIFLGRPAELWGSIHDTITLRSFSGTILSQLSY